MNNLLKSPKELPRSRGMNLILTEVGARNAIPELIATLLSHGPLFVIAGGDGLPISKLTDILSATMPEITQILSRLYTARASTCYELFEALADRRSNGEAILVLDFLHTFYDAEIPLSIRVLRLSQCCRELQRLAFYRPVTVIRTDIGVDDSDDFLSVLNSVADKTFSLASPSESRKKIALF